MWKKWVLALETAAPLLPTGHVLFSPLSLCACVRASDCIWTIYFYPPSSPPSLSPQALRPEPLIREEPGPCSVQHLLALGSAWLQRAVISQPALLSSSQ